MKIQHLCGAIVFLAAASILIAPVSEAQGMPHAIIGYVTDTGGNAVSGAEVTLTNQRTGDTMTATANAYGQYQADLSVLESGYQIGDIISVKATSGSLEGSSSVTVTASALDQCDVVLNTDIPEDTPFSGAMAIICIAAFLAACIGMFSRRRN